MTVKPPKRPVVPQKGDLKIFARDFATLLLVVVGVGLVVQWFLL